MMAAPRCWTVGMKSLSTQSWSPMTSMAGLPPIWAWKMSGYWVAEWLPQIVMRGDVGDVATPALAATWASARLWSRRVIAVKFFAGSRSQLFMAIRQLVLAGLPTTSTLQSSAAAADSALPWTVKMAPLASSRSARSMPWVRGREPTSRAHVGTLEGGLGLVGLHDAVQQRERAVLELHGHALQGAEGGRDLEQLELDRGVRAEQVAVRDAEEEAVADLAGSAGDGHSSGGCHGSGPYPGGL